jgi:threonine dehydratase
MEDGVHRTLTTWPIVRDHLELVITATDAQVVEAMRRVWRRMKLLIEPSAAVAVVAVLSEPFRGLGGARRVGIILSRGNVDLDHLPW